jgi:hypothetical protein
MFVADNLCLDLSGKRGSKFYYYLEYLYLSAYLFVLIRDFLEFDSKLRFALLCFAVAILV